MRTRKHTQRRERERLFDKQIRRINFPREAERAGGGRRGQAGAKTVSPRGGWRGKRGKMLIGKLREIFNIGQPSSLSTGESYLAGRYKLSSSDKLYL